MVKAKYSCWECKHEFTGAPGPKQPDDTPTQCPECGHIYLTWHNYKKFLVDPER